ncbi:hypothetical protein PAHAL_1G190100 [Panicum hallii]|uniref:Uncharacterized protein n=1 Tax=Panicum hallii TaxID=206008 RepID=A0A2T8KVR1_9POAL|nr:hypothetical protein PAHAL_1G190100 [Panicum hallii]
MDLDRSCGRGGEARDWIRPDQSRCSHALHSAPPLHRLPLHRAALPVYSGECSSAERGTLGIRADEAGPPIRHPRHRIPASGRLRGRWRSNGSTGSIVGVEDRGHSVLRRHGAVRGAVVDIPAGGACAGVGGATDQPAPGPADEDWGRSAPRRHGAVQRLVVASVEAAAIESWRSLWVGVRVATGRGPRMKLRTARLVSGVDADEAGVGVGNLGSAPFAALVWTRGIQPWRGQKSTGRGGVARAPSRRGGAAGTVAASIQAFLTRRPR